MSQDWGSQNGDAQDLTAEQIMEIQAAAWQQEFDVDAGQEFDDDAWLTDGEDDGIEIDWDLNFPVENKNDS